MKKGIFFLTVILIFSNNIFSQNVGIGTSTPLMRLHVSKTDSAVALFENTQSLNTNVSNAIYFKTGNGVYPYTGAVKTIGQGSTTARLGFFTYSSLTANGLLERMSITDNGYAGIGTTTPQTIFHINPNAAGSLLIGTNKFSGGYTNLEMGISSQFNGYGYLQSTYSSGGSWGDIILNPNGGNVGVNTNATSATMDINGSIALPIKVVTASYNIQFPDYTIVVDMQNDSTKLVNIYLPLQTLSVGRVLKIVAINMKPFYTSPNNHGIIKVFNSTGSVLLEQLYNSYQQDNSQNQFLHVPQTDITIDIHTSITLQCMGAAGWVVTDMMSKYDRIEYTD